MEGVHGGRTLNLELVQLLDSLQNSHAWLKGHHDGNLVWAAAEAHLAKAESFQVLAGQLKALERLAGRRIAQQSTTRKSPRGRYWAPPKRKPASGDVLTLDTLVIALQGVGLTACEGKKAVKAIFDGMIQELQDGGNVETPLGVFQFGRRPSARSFDWAGGESSTHSPRKSSSEFPGSCRTLAIDPYQRRSLCLT